MRNPWWTDKGCSHVVLTSALVDMYKSRRSRGRECLRLIDSLFLHGRLFVIPPAPLTSLHLVRARFKRLMQPSLSQRAPRVKICVGSSHLGTVAMLCGHSPSRQCQPKPHTRHIPVIPRLPAGRRYSCLTCRPPADGLPLTSRFPRSL